MAAAFFGADFRPSLFSIDQYAEVLGRGAFKIVYKAFDELDGREVAWNQVKVNDMVTSPIERERLFAEITVLKQLKHKVSRCAAAPLFRPAWPLW